MTAEFKFSKDTETCSISIPHPDWWPEQLKNGKRIHTEIFQKPIQCRDFLDISHSIGEDGDLIVDTK